MNILTKSRPLQTSRALNSGTDNTSIFTTNKRRKYCIVYHRTVRLLNSFWFEVKAPEPQNCHVLTTLNTAGRPLWLVDCTVPPAPVRRYHQHSTHVLTRGLAPSTPPCGKLYIPVTLFSSNAPRFLHCFSQIHCTDCRIGLSSDT
ncbi:hypothetical protein E2C01_077663 [Portunus trituberculatus]|uniref:Uncharacterized protein n=1 Tax=Portunus trituberculatus TaxID=210409 RepID=A0A5B7IS30_PORTR|nr:hypothetical protein [Portunus trituberculatus]